MVDHALAGGDGADCVSKLTAYDTRPTSWRGVKVRPERSVDREISGVSRLSGEPRVGAYWICQARLKAGASVGCAPI